MHNYIVKFVFQNKPDVVHTANNREEDLVNYIAYLASKEYTSFINSSTGEAVVINLKQVLYFNVTEI